MKYTIILLSVLAAAPGYAKENLYQGIFIYAEGAEYESVFIPCDSKEVWRVAEGSKQKHLVAKASTTTTKEIPVSLVLDVTPTDKRKYPQ